MDENVRKNLTRGREHYRAGEYDEAARALAPLAAANLPFADVYCMLGVIHHVNGRLDRAEELFVEALRLNPAYTEAAMNLAVTYNELGRYAEAREVHDKLLAARKRGASGAVDPYVKGKIANMHAEVAEAYEQASLHREAAREYQHALELQPGYLDLRTRLGVALRAAGDTDGAIRQLEQVKRENPKLVPALLQLGMTYFLAGRHADAEQEWQAVLFLAPDNKFAKMYLGLAKPGG